MKKILFSVTMLWLSLTPMALAQQEHGKEKGEVSTKERSLWTDTKVSFSWLLRASYEQFIEPNNAYYLAAGVPITWYTFNTDRKLMDKIGLKKVSGLEQFASDSSIVMNTPLLPLGLWYWGRKTGNSKLMQFAMETAAATYLALAESGLLSHIQIHHRPSTQDLNFFETAFRGDSSWPSGHVIPYFTLMFKTFQFYGPAWALLPTAMAYLTAVQRMKDDRHWPSDIAGAFFLSAFASEGVRRVAKYKQNHPLYRWIFEHEAHIGLLRYQKALGPKITWFY